MAMYWKLDTHGDPLGSISRFLQELWVSKHLDMLIVAPDGHPHLLESPEQVPQTNPFHPMMKVNLACLVESALKQYPEKKIGAVLRSCELRALNELCQKGAFDKGAVTMICVDCLGTYAVDEIGWRTERLDAPKGLGEETLRFAAQGGIASYRYRPACQVCKQPGATDGNVNLCVLGLPIRQEMLVSAETGDSDIDKISNGLASQALILKREKMLERISERNQRTRERLIDSLENWMPQDIDTLLDQFLACNACQSCREVCPIASFDTPRQAENGRLLRTDVISWLVSCAGCGMCEQSCPKKLPLLAIFNRIRDQLSSGLIS